MKELIKHLHTGQVKIGNELYKPNSKGEIYLPERFEQFNPVDEPIEEKKVVKKKATKKEK